MDEPVTHAAPDAPDAAVPAVVEAPAPVVEAPAAAPWSAKLEARFTDPAVRAEVDAYLRAEHQPYVTKIETELADAKNKTWVFDGLNSDDPSETLADIVGQVYGEDVADRIIELLNAGETPDDAAAIANAEVETGEVADLSKLPPEVRDAVEYAKTAREREAAAEVARTEQESLAQATALYDTWRADVLAKNPDVKENALHAYVFAADGDMDQGLANYRADFPAPAAPGKPATPETLGGSTLGGIPASRATSSLGDAFGEVFDGAAGTITI